MKTKKMEINISIREPNSKQEIINLKEYIDKASIEGLKSTEIDTKSTDLGQMGTGDILSSITTMIEAAEKPLIELIKCLQKFVNNYRTEIEIPTKTGEKIKISHGRSMTTEQLTKLVVAIQESSK